MIPITSEYSYFQYLTAISFMLFGIMGSFCNRVPKLLRFLVLFTSSFLAMDELFMFHECLKVSFFHGLHSEHLRDITTISYFILAITAFLFFFKYMLWNFKTRITISFVFIFCILVLLNDVFGYTSSDKLEESSELLSGIFLSLFFILQIEKRPSIADVLQKITLSFSSFALLGYIFIQRRPNLCPYVDQRSRIEFYQHNDLIFFR